MLALLGYYSCWILFQGYFPSTSAQGICPRCSFASRCSISFYQSKRTWCTSWHPLSLEANARSEWWPHFEITISGMSLAWQNQRARTRPSWYQSQSCQIALNMLFEISYSEGILKWSFDHCLFCHFWPFRWSYRQGISHLRNQDRHISLFGARRPMILKLKGCHCWEEWTLFSWRQTLEISRIFGYQELSLISFWP